MNTQHRLDDKLLAALLVTWSLVLAVASAASFLGRVEAPRGVVSAQVAQPVASENAQVALAR